MEDEGRAWFKKIEDGDNGSHGDLHVVQGGHAQGHQMGVRPAGACRLIPYAGESFYNDKMAPVVEELREKGLLIESPRGAGRRSGG